MSLSSSSGSGGSRPPPSRPPVGGLTPAERLRILWKRGKPDLDAFLADIGLLPPDEVAAVLRADQRERWRSGERTPAEHYVSRLPSDPPDREAVIDLVYNEFLLREELGEHPDAEEFCRRFPAVAQTIRDQISLHQAVAGQPTLEPDAAPTGGSAPAPPEPLPESLPRPFGRYRLLSILGRGSMGTVYLADDPQLGRRVALKVPRFDPERAAEAAGRFRREAWSAAAVRHPHLSPVYDLGQVDGVDYLTMPYIEGESLAARLARDRTLPVREAARLAVRVAEAMHAAHKAGVVHRDLKPSNVLLDEQGDPVVMDFGLARRIGGTDPRMTAPGAVIGTASYLPPEQIGCDPGAMGPRCDVYSLGVILYEMVTGQVPFRGSTNEVLAQVLVDEPEPPSKWRPGLDPRLEAACLKAMAKDPGGRFASMAEFADALRPLTAEAPAAPAARRVPWGLIAAGVLVLAGLVVLAVVLGR